MVEFPEIKRAKLKEIETSEMTYDIYDEFEIEYERLSRAAFNLHLINEIEKMVQLAERRRAEGATGMGAFIHVPMVWIEHLKKEIEVNEK